MSDRALAEEARPIDPWREAHAPWVPPAGDRAARTQARQFVKPAIWQFIIDPAARALLAEIAGEVLAGAAFGFGGRVLDQLRARGAAAHTATERERLRALDVVVSAHLEDLSDLRTCTLALAKEAS